MKVFESALLIGKRLNLTTASEEVEVSERRKKAGTAGSIWSESLAEVAGKQGEWIQHGKRLRAGVSAVVLVPKTSFKFGVILNRFDAGHPTAAGKLSTPAGIWEGKESLLDSALRELGEEVILVDGSNCGFWTYNGQLLAEQWVKEYTSFHGMEISDFKAEILPFEAEGTFEIYLDGEYQGNALLAYEPETGSIEIIFVFETAIHLDGMLRDGERFNGQWLNREVGIYSLKDIFKEENITSKVEAVEEFLYK